MKGEIQMLDWIKIFYAVLLPSISALIALLIVAVVQFSIWILLEKVEFKNMKWAALVHPYTCFDRMKQWAKKNNDFQGRIEDVWILIAVYFATLFQIALFYKLPIFSTKVVWALFIPVLVAFVLTRIWSYQVVKGQESAMQQLQVLRAQKEEKQIDLLTFESKLQKLQNDIAIQIQKLNQLERQLNLNEQKWNVVEKEIKVEETRIQRLYNKVAANLKVIEKLEADAHIAIDTNVLMEWDTYLLDALRNRQLIISKRVQKELDKNKSREDDTVRYKARRGIRYLLSLNAHDYKLICGKWDKATLEEHGISPEWEDERIIADYFDYLQGGHKVYVASDDANFIISAKPHFPILTFPYPRLFA